MLSLRPHLASGPPKSENGYLRGWYPGQMIAPQRSVSSGFGAIRPKEQHR